MWVGSYVSVEAFLFRALFPKTQFGLCFVWCPNSHCQTCWFKFVVSWPRVSASVWSRRFFFAIPSFPQQSSWFVTVTHGGGSSCDVRFPSCLFRSLADTISYFYRMLDVDLQSTSSWGLPLGAEVFHGFFPKSFLFFVFVEVNFFLLVFFCHDFLLAFPHVVLFHVLSLSCTCVPGCVAIFALDCFHLNY